MAKKVVKKEAARDPRRVTLAGLTNDVDAAESLYMQFVESRSLAVTSIDRQLHALTKLRKSAMGIDGK